MVNNNTKTTFYTDHESLNRLLVTRSELTGRDLRWIQTIEDAAGEFEIVYNPGKDNVVADALSRRPDHFLCALRAVTPHVELIRDIQAAYSRDSESIKIMQLLHNYETLLNSEDQQIRSEAKCDYFWHDDVIYFKSVHGPRVFVPDVGSLRATVLGEHHDIGLAGHLGITKTLDYVLRTFYWPHLKDTVRQYVRSCDSCQRNKAQTLLPAGLLHPLPIPLRRWDSISMDFIVRLPVTPRGFDSIITVVDRLSKMVHFIPTTTNVTSEEVAYLFFDNVVALHGVPSDIISDRDSKFTAEFWSFLWQSFGTRLKMSTAFHPQTDGQSEKANKVLEDMLRTFCVDYSEWDRHLKYAEFSVNNSVSLSTTYTPFYLNFGQHPNVPIAKALSPADLPGDTRRFVLALDRTLAHARACLKVAQLYQAEQANKKRRALLFQPGDMVLLDSKNVSLQGDDPLKFRPRFTGAYKILRKISDVAYELEIPSNNYNVFHVSYLRPYNDGSSQFPSRKVDSRPGAVWSYRRQKYFAFDRILDYATENGVKGFKVVYVGHPPEFCARDVLMHDVPNDVLLFEAAHPTSLPATPRGGRTRRGRGRGGRGRRGRGRA